MASRIDGNMYVSGNLSTKTMNIPTDTVDDEDVKAGADITATKLEHQYQKVYAQESDTVASAEDRTIHVVYGTSGEVVGFEAGSVVACIGDSTITIDLHKNGASILTAPITLDSSNSAYTPEEGTINTSSLNDGDVLEIVITVNAGLGTLGKGVFASAIIREKAQ